MLEEAKQICPTTTRRLVGEGALLVDVRERAVVVDTNEPDRRIDLQHDNEKKYGTVFNTVAPGTDVIGVMRRA